MIPLILAAYGAGGLNGEVSVSGHSVSTADVGSGARSCESGIRFNADGTVDQKEDNGGGASYSQIDSSTDWIIPNAAGQRQYYVRATEDTYTENETATALFGVRNGTMATWLTLGNGTSREWSLDTGSNTAGAGDIEWVITVEIATDSGGTDVIATAQYTLDGLVG